MCAPPYSGKWLTATYPSVPIRMVDEGIAVKIDRPGLHQHEDPGGDERHCAVFPWSAAKPTRPTPPRRSRAVAHFRTAPKVMPRSKMPTQQDREQNRMGMTNSVVAAATAGQS